MKADILNLFEPLQIGSITVPNRIVMSPMSQHSAAPDGSATPWHMVHIGSRAVGGCGLILMEDTAVNPKGRVSTKGLSLSESKHADSIRPIAQFCIDQGAVPGIQIAHAGRKGWRDKLGHGLAPIGATAEPFTEGWATPRPATQDDLHEVVDSFVASAKLAQDAGLPVIEVHSSNGYLLHQFLSPLSNTRNDKYGGSAEGRCRLLLEVVEATRKTFAEGALFVRLPAADEVEGGLTTEAIVEIALALEEIGVDAIDVAGGTLGANRQPVSNEVQHATAAALKSSTNMVIAGGGGIGTADQAEARVTEGGCDLITLARPLLLDPYWPIHAADALGCDPIWPSQYPVGR
jgi:2,4-dienoyl-CoA reductase-like NADH-dependent reductase (Old Yellow Enzyme family)